MIDFVVLGISERKIFDFFVVKLILIFRCVIVLNLFNVFLLFDYCIIFIERFILNLEVKSFFYIIFSCRNLDFDLFVLGWINRCI